MWNLGAGFYSPFTFDLLSSSCLLFHVQGMGETLNNYKSDADDTHVGKVSTFDTTPPVTSKMKPLNTILLEGWQDVESQKSNHRETALVFIFCWSMGCLE